jgi:hypothetical protein
MKSSAALKFPLELQGREMGNIVSHFCMRGSGWRDFLTDYALPTLLCYTAAQIALLAKKQIPLHGDLH